VSQLSIIAFSLTSSGRSAIRVDIFGAGAGFFAGSFFTGSFFTGAFFTGAFFTGVCIGSTGCPFSAFNGVFINLTSGLIAGSGVFFTFFFLLVFLLIRLLLMLYIHPLL